MNRRQRLTSLRPLVTYVALSVVTLLFLAPFLWMVSTSLKTDDQVFQESVRWIPPKLIWANYSAALQSFPFLLYLRNTLLVCVMCTIGTVISSLLPAYGFAKLKWKGRDAIFIILICTIMLPTQVTMLPVFLIFRWLGWTGTFKPLIIPAFFGSAFSIFLLRQFLLGIPQELSDAARIDGCNELSILGRIIVPAAKPAIITVALFAFTNAWMDFVGPLMYLHDEQNYTLAIGIQAFLGRHSGEWNLLMACATVLTIPMVLLFLAAQKTFIQGVTLTGLKG